MTQNQIAYRNLKEQERSNLAREAETNRSNLAQEQENQRAHLAQEAETKRSNLARETETNRSNLANELLKNQQLAETVRSNTANEAIKRQQNAEAHRSNVENEYLKHQSNIITDTHNEVMETIQSNQNQRMYLLEQDRIAAQAEIARKDRESAEKRATEANKTSVITSTIRAIGGLAGALPKYLTGGKASGKTKN